jgi:hypothetical protein
VQTSYRKTPRVAPVGVSCFSAFPAQVAAFPAHPAALSIPTESSRGATGTLTVPLDPRNSPAKTLKVSGYHSSQSYQPGSPRHPMRHFERDLQRSIGRRFAPLAAAQPAAPRRSLWAFPSEMSLAPRNRSRPHDHRRTAPRGRRHAGLLRLRARSARPTDPGQAPGPENLPETDTDCLDVLSETAPVSRLANGFREERERSTACT